MAYRTASVSTRLACLVVIATAAWVAAAVSDAFAVTTQRWNSEPIQAPATSIVAPVYGGVFSEVACVSSTDCWTVGRGIAATRQHVAFIEHWNGHGFKLSHGPVANAILQGLDCLSASDCMIAGAAAQSNGDFVPLIERWNGKRWSKMKVPGGTGTDVELADVTCASKTRCEAIGWNATFAGSTALVEQWNGKHWSIVGKDSKLGPAGQQYVYLDQIRCTGSSSCIVTGQSTAQGGSPPQAFADRYSRGRWSLKEIPVPDPRSYAETAVSYFSCVSASSCLGVGTASLWPQSSAANANVPFVVRWNGAGWAEDYPALSPSQEASSHASAFSGVWCESSNWCWAVGDSDTGTSRAPGVTAFWNGSSFTIGANDNPYPSDFLDAVGCTSKSFCLAVGSGIPAGSGVYHPIALKLKIINCPRCTARDTVADRLHS